MISKALLTVVIACLAVGGASGAAVSSIIEGSQTIEGPQTIDLPDGSLIIPGDGGDPYYFFENGSVISNQVFKVPADNYENVVIVWPENYVPSSDNYDITIVWPSDNYVPSSDNFAIVWPSDNYAIMPTDDNFMYVCPIRPVYICFQDPEDMEWQEYPNWTWIEGWPERISVGWPEEGPYEYNIRTMCKITVSGRTECWKVFTLELPSTA